MSENMLYMSFYLLFGFLEEFFDKEGHVIMKTKIGVTLPQSIEWHKLEETRKDSVIETLEETP
jgi:hypothetical protein